MDCMLFHCGGHNKAARERRAINHAFTIPYFKQQIDIPLSISPAGLTLKEGASGLQLPDADVCRGLPVLPEKEQ